MTTQTQPAPPAKPARPSMRSLVFRTLEKKGVLTTVAGGETDLKGTLVVPATMPVQYEQPTDWPKHWPVCPAHINPREWRRALENRDYYQYKALEANQPGMYWYNFPRQDLQYSELVYCDPEMMKELKLRMPINRPEDRAHMDAVARDIDGERWLQTSESLDINTLGNFQNGQHRADACIKVNKGWVFYVTWNVPPESIFVTDSGKRRSTNQQVQLVFDSKLTSKHTAVCRAMMNGLNKGKVWSDSEIADFAVQYAEVLEWVTDKLTSRKPERNYRADVQAVIAKVYLYWGKDTIEPFADRMATLNWTGDGDPVKSLWEWIQRAKKEHEPPVMYYKKTLGAIQAHLEGREYFNVHAKDEDVFQWKAPEWEVPPNPKKR